ncbi:MAG TPA: RNA 2',3'-cyclic phosphodiesterase [bacterium]|nr:RNA 2',3'-cyclic phosphodiesterase [bacterium]
MTAARRRIFIAVPLDPALHEAVLRLQRLLEEDGIRLRWVAPPNLHITLRFLGQITERELERAREAARRACREVPAFRITLAGVGAFPDLRRPQVVWVGVTDGAGTMAELARRLDDALARERFAPDPRGFAPHMTLARVRDPALQARLSRSLPGLREERVGEQGVTAVVVMESLLGPQGAVYTPVEEVRLFGHEK